MDKDFDKLTLEKTKSTNANNMPPITRSKVMQNVFKYLPRSDVLKCNMVAKRWYENEIPNYFNKVNCLNTVIIKVGSQEQMQPDLVNDQRGFELSGGPAPYSSTMKSFEFQDGMWGKWIEADFDDENKTHFDMYDSPE